MAARRAWLSPRYCREQWEYGVRIPVGAFRVVAAGDREYAMSSVRLPDEAVIWQVHLWQSQAVASWGGRVRIGVADWLPTNEAEFDGVEQVLHPSWYDSEAGGEWGCAGYPALTLDVMIPIAPQGRRLVWEFRNQHTAAFYIGGIVVVSAMPKGV